MERSLTGEAVNVTLLNTLVAILAGLIIFPACFAYNVTPDSGPSLVFVTLPRSVRPDAELGNIWGALFFVFMSFAALSHRYRCVRESDRFTMDKWDVDRKRAVAIGVLVVVLSLP